tara:strand:- start:27204 stop:28538 length:1335 start_codon:yes stop_codon:yes gene_type:complete
MEQSNSLKIGFENKSFSRNRRLKSFLFLLTCLIVTIYPHIAYQKIYFPIVVCFSLIVASYGLIIIAKNNIKLASSNDEKKIPQEELPSLDIIVAARDEQNVISSLVERLFFLDYPKEKLNIYIIDDGSSDNTPLILDKLSKKFERLHIISRSKDSGGGKSGALNYALQFTSGEWLLILDADAQIQNDTLQKVFEFAFKDSWSVVQLRKSVLNSNKNLLTNCQSIEMVMDAVFQYGRLLLAEVSELRGNGQLIKKDVLVECGAFNENTVTDDLDLSVRLLLNQANIGILLNPSVKEEGVENISALFSQRQRWAEGGLQRFFDYWQPLVFGDLDLSKRFDILYFFILQYALPIITLLDLIISIIFLKQPIYWPISLTAFMLSGIASWYGCYGKNESSNIPKPSFLKLVLYLGYLSHWFVVIPWVTLKMSFLKKKILWKKTIHKGFN